MDGKEWRGIRRDANRAGRFSLGWVIIAVVFILVISVAVWYFKVATSDVKGQGDAEIQKNSGTNRVEKQERFHQLFQGIKATDDKIVDAKIALDGAPDDTVARTNYTGLRNNCREQVAEYNALARSYSAAQFRDLDLPQEIDSNNPETDCKPDNTKE